MSKEKKPKPFEIQTMGHELALRIGTCICNLYRKTPDIDHICIDLDEYPGVATEEGSILRIFNNEDLTRWMAGIAFEETIRGVFLPGSVEMNGKTFREKYHWNPPAIIREEASEQEKQWWTELQVTDLDKEWSAFDA